MRKILFRINLSSIVCPLFPFLSFNIFANSASLLAVDFGLYKLETTWGCPDHFPVLSSPRPEEAQWVRLVGQNLFVRGKWSLDNLNQFSQPVPHYHLLVFGLSLLLSHLTVDVNVSLTF